MIDVKSTELKAIITTDIDLEHETCEDIENALAFSLSSVQCLPLERSGIALVYAEKHSDPLQIVKKLIRSSVRCHWVFPIYASCKSMYEEIKKCVMELLLLSNVSKPIKMVCRCRKRGWSIDSCSRLVKYIGSFLESLNIVVVDYKNPEYVLRLEIVNEITGLSFYHKTQEREFRMGRY
ncbi:hypothetical protein QPL79_01585 [Ignisphaera sp. 4213-co]|uniref:THUMP domain-containing protein n=1 Tax=Ignisphaera cupida TaxID=3050454 RepID=A0ABD4Z415_9CREN|nr:hypothetical protein [Ignisphaera sp. 4213-co]MDK6028056.1 hypothetical protein [Ignisphaera sp. 4213-co]